MGFDSQNLSIPECSLNIKGGESRYPLDKVRCTPQLTKGERHQKTETCSGNTFCILHSLNKTKIHKLALKIHHKFNQDIFILAEKRASGMGAGI